MPKNPRFTDAAIEPLTFPDVNKIKCRDCMLREKDRPMNGWTIYGATLSMCDAFGDKPYEIAFNNEDCPYYISDSEEDD